MPAHALVCTDAWQWSLPLENGVEAITRLQHWLTGNEELARIPISSAGIFVHAPIEVRVTDSSRITNPRAWLDQSISDGPTMYLNATLYRPFLKTVKHWERYYQAFEYLMKDLGGKPHWAKNFVSVSPSDFWKMYPDMEKWVKLREQVDPSGVFVNEWLKRCILNGPEAQKAIEEGDGFVLIGQDGEAI